MPRDLPGSERPSEGYTPRIDVIGSVLANWLADALAQTGSHVRNRFFDDDVANRLRQILESALALAVRDALPMNVATMQIDHFASLLATGLSNPEGASVVTASLSWHAESQVSLRLFWRTQIKKFVTDIVAAEFATEFSIDIFVDRFPDHFWALLHNELAIDSPLHSYVLGADLFVIRAKLDEILLERKSRYSTSTASRPSSAETAVESSNLAPREFAAGMPGLLLGSTLASYELLHTLGRGGSGWVFLGVNRRTHKEVAVKVFYPFRDTPSALLLAMDNGFRALSRLKHPSIVETYAVDDLEIGGVRSMYIIMEMVHGMTLENWALRIESDSYPNGIHLSVESRKLVAARQLAEALAVAHETTFLSSAGIEQSGVLHGDIKPDNILVTESEQLKLTDFLLADIQRAIDPRCVPSEPEAWWTWMFGTPEYMSPEQADEGILTKRADIYSLGVTLACLLFPGHHRVPALSLKMLFEDRSIDMRLKSLIRSMVASSPSERPPSAAVVVDVFDDILR